MGTRSLTFVYNSLKEQPVACMYRQYDGYPTGHGLELARFLNQFEAITNGIRVGETRKTANGMGCLAVQMLVQFKTDVGGIYLYPTNTDDAGQEYEYHIYDDSVVVKNRENTVIFEGTWAELTEFCTEKSVA
jgi:hypothetical protein